MQLCRRSFSIQLYQRNLVEETALRYKTNPLG